MSTAFSPIGCVAFCAHPSQIGTMLAKQIGANIRAAREAKGLSLQDVAAAVVPKTTYQTLGRLELAQRPLTLQWVEKIARAMKVDPLELLRPSVESTERPVIRLDEQVATEAARTLAAAALADPDPHWGSVAAVSEVLREILLTFAKFPEAQTDVRVARPAIAAVGRRFVPEAH